MRGQMTRLAAVAATLTLAVALTAPASAFAVKPNDKPVPFASGPMSVQFGPAVEAGSQAAIVGVTLDDSVKLPVMVRIPIPENASIGWAGEVLGGDPSQDPTAQYNVETGAGGGRYAIFELKQSHTGQIDTYAAPPTQNGADVSAEMSYVQSVPATQTTISVRLPANISEVKLTPAALVAPATNAAGETLYTVLQRKLATGEKVDVSASYRIGSPSRAAATMPVLIALVIALLAVVIALVFVLQRGSGGAAAGADEDEDDEAAEDTAAAPEPDAADDAPEADEVVATAGAEGRHASSEAGREPEDDDPFGSIDFD